MAPAEGGGDSKGSNQLQEYQNGRTARAPRQPIGLHPASEADLTVARAYLRALGKVLLEAATSPDPRVVALGVALARSQGGA